MIKTDLHRRAGPVTGAIKVVRVFQIARFHEELHAALVGACGRPGSSLSSDSGDQRLREARLRLGERGPWARAYILRRLVGASEPSEPSAPAKAAQSLRACSHVDGGPPPGWASAGEQPCSGIKAAGAGLGAARGCFLSVWSGGVKRGRSRGRDGASRGAT